MAWTIIVASSQGDQLDALTDGAQEIAAKMGDSATVVQATSVEQVSKRRKSAVGREQLLIISALLPSRDASPDPHAVPGLDLIKSIAQEPEPPACILVSQDMKHFLAVQPIKRCELLYVDCATDYVRDCLQLARKLELIGTCAAQAAPLPQGARQGRSGASAAGPRIQSPSLANGSLAEAQSAGGEVPLPHRNVAANYALVEVHLLNNAQSGFVTIGGRSPQPLNLDRDAVDEFIKESQSLAERLNKMRESEERWRRYSQQWSAEYQRLGERIGKLLWPTVFGALFRIAYGQANGNVRLRFNLDQPYFDGAWEAIYDELSQNFLMLGNTITVARRANQLNTSALAIGGSHFTSGQIGGEDGVLNIIVIQSNVPHDSTPIGPDDRLWEKYWGSLKSTLSGLPHIEEEVEMLRRVGREYRARARTSGTRPKVEVEVLVPRPGKSLRALVEHRLKDRSRPYDIVHFAGHALFARSPVPQDRRGYLIFSGEPGMEPHAVPAATVADWLEGSGVQLIYLSCCRSSAAAAALELAAHNVPLTIGFNWDLDDKKAVDFARDFYTELLDAELKVCPAFSKARRNLHGYFNGGDPIWAAPVLIAQPEEWVYVEGVLQPVSRQRSKARPRRSYGSPPTPPARSDAMPTAA
jgi:hypothetical protein